MDKTAGEYLHLLEAMMASLGLLVGNRVSFLQLACHTQAEALLVSLL
jgi:hypothetical protein